MLITFTQSGSLFNVDFQFDSFNQGDNNTHIVDVVVLDESFSNYEYNGYIQFIREGDKLPSDKFVMANKRIIVDGVAYNGYTFKMASDWFTAVAGVLKATVEIKKFSNGVMESNKAYGIVNIPVQASVSAISEVESKITDEEYNSLVDLINSKLNKDDYDIEDLGYLDTNEDEAIKTAIQHRLNNYSNSNIYKYTIPTPGGKVDGIVMLGYDLSAMWAISISGNNIKSYEVDTTKNEVVLINRDVNVQQLSSTKANISNIKVSTNIEVPAPVGNANAVNKYYLDSNHYNKNEIDSSFQNIETNLNYNIQGALDSSKSYTDLKHNELKALLDTLLEDAPTAYDTLKEIADYIASDKTGASEMLSKINNNTSEINVIKQGLPETLDIILRSEVSEGTTEEVKEMEINGMKFKVGSATSSESAIKGKLVASGTLQATDGCYSAIYNFENGKYYQVLIYNPYGVQLSSFGYCIDNRFKTTFSMDDNDSACIIIQSEDFMDIWDMSANPLDNYDGLPYEVYELVAPVGSGSGSEKQVLTWNDIKDVATYSVDTEEPSITIYLNEQYDNSEITIDMKNSPIGKYESIEELFYNEMAQEFGNLYIYINGNPSNFKINIEWNEPITSSVECGFMWDNKLAIYYSYKVGTASIYKNAIKNFITFSMNELADYYFTLETKDNYYDIKDLRNMEV